MNGLWAGLNPSRWSTPAVGGFGRLPMASRLVPYDDVAAAVADAPSPWVRSLDGDWDFRLLKSPDEIDAAAAGRVGDDSGWDRITVPGSWMLPAHFERPAADQFPIYLNVRMPFGGQPPDAPADNPTGVYRRTFTLPASWRRRRTHLRVGAADSMGLVWVNGMFIGVGTDSHLASTFDITPALHRGNNTVCIAVPRWSAWSWIEDQDQWWIPGLHRSVELVSVPPVSMADTAMVPGLHADGTTGVLEFDITVDAATGDVGRLTLEVEVRTLGRRSRRLATSGGVDVPDWDAMVAEHGNIVPPHIWPGRRVHRLVEVPGIEPWHHESPTLYRATAVLRDVDGDVLDVRTRRVGFRRVEIADRALLVNGLPVVINGVNHHDIHPDRGPATTAADSRRDLELLKRHHVNAVRTSHYPHDEHFYDLCDELGLYVIDEADIESHARWAAISHDPAYAGAFLERGMRMVLRDRSHPCVIAWSLGNESGYGPAHDAMAAWIRRVDPSRPVHYEGGFSGNLDSDNTASDIVCPMYASVERIVEWSRSGRDRRPLILCEYSHAMGQAGGLADYWAVFGLEEGLQGGFVWEFADHALRRTAADGTTWFAYGGDFREADHDSNFVCDGLVSPDRDPHPLLIELAAINQPVHVELTGRGNLRIANRRWFTGLGDLQARWELSVDGKVVRRGRLDVPDVPPRSDITVDNPSGDVTSPGRAVLTVTFTRTSRSVPSWADGGDVVATCQVDLPSAGEAPRRRPRGSARQLPVVADDDGITVGDVRLGWPILSLWRPPTDNDEPILWPKQEWRNLGLDQLAPDDVDVDVRGRGGTTTRIARYATSDRRAIVHRQRIEPTGDGTGGVRVTDRIDVDRTLRDLPRVGVGFALPSDFDRLTWLGLGPGDSYPDRRAAARFGRWEERVDGAALPFIVPQEYGLHLDTEWFQLASSAAMVRFDLDRPLAFSALTHSAAELTAARHAHELPAPSATHVHIDAAHRGLGTAACGPDVHPRFQVHGGRYRFSWTLSGAAQLR